MWLAVLFRLGNFYFSSSASLSDSLFLFIHSDYYAVTKYQARLRAKRKKCAEKRNLFCFPLSHVALVVVQIFFLYFPLFTGFRRLGFLPWKFSRFLSHRLWHEKCSKLLFFCVCKFTKRADISVVDCFLGPVVYVTRRFARKNTFRTHTRV